MTLEYVFSSYLLLSVATVLVSADVTRSGISLIVLRLSSKFAPFVFEWYKRDVITSTVSVQLIPEVCSYCTFFYCRLRRCLCVKSLFLRLKSRHFLSLGTFPSGVLLPQRSHVPAQSMTIPKSDTNDLLVFTSMFNGYRIDVRGYWMWSPYLPVPNPAWMMDSSSGFLT